ncbi:MAG: DUF177 domain-containing protein [Christensenellales bacterium]
MALDISRALRCPGESFPFRHEESLAPQEVLGDTVSFDVPVLLTGTFTLDQERLRLKGVLTASARATCANCLGPALYPVRVDFDEIFEKFDRFAKVEDILDETDRLAYDGPQLELHQLALTLVLLEMPLRFLCREDCKGLQTVARIHDTLADQKELPSEHPFSVLQQWLNKDQEV